MTDAISNSFNDSIDNFKKASEIDAQSASKLAKKMGGIERDLMEAFVSTDNSRELLTIAKKYDLFGDKTAAEVKDNKNLTVDVVVQGLKMKYDKITRAFQAFLQTSRSAHETMMATIRNMRVG